MQNSNSLILSSGDLLWRTAAEYLTRRFGSDKGIWKVASSTCADCQLCQECGGGALMKCCHENCKKEYHFDCAFQEGGLSLEEDGRLLFYCSEHFKPILFCSCQQKYDESRAMICCDECCEWFHCSCVGLQTKDASKLDKYICPSCRLILRNGQKVPQSLKDKNMIKEQRSSCHQTAIKSISVLVEVAVNICPIIDSLHSFASDARQRLQTDKLKEYVEFLTSPIFFPSENNAQESDYGEKFGCNTLMSKFRDELVQLSQEYSNWTSNAIVFIDKMADVAKLPIEFTKERYQSWFLYQNELIELENTVPGCILSHVEVILLIFDCIHWIEDFYSFLFVADTGSDQWLSQLNIHIRHSALRTRKFVSFSKDQLGMAWGTIFQEEVNGAANLVAKLNDWFKDVSMSMQQGSERSINRSSSFVLESLNKLVNNAQLFEFPLATKIALIDMKSAIDELEEELKTFLVNTFESIESSSSLASHMDSLRSRRSSISVVGPQSHEFDVCLALIEIKNSSKSFFSTPRSSVKEFEGLFTAISSQLMNEETTNLNISNLRSSLLIDLKSIFEELKSIDNSITETRNLVSNQLLEGKYDDMDGYNKLRTHAIISDEETAFMFLLESDNLKSSLENAINRSIRMNIDDFSKIRSEFMKAWEESFEAIQKFSSSCARLEAIQLLFGQLGEEFDRAVQVWESLGKFIEEFSSGVGGDMEELLGLWRQAQDCLFGNPKLEEIVQSKQEQNQFIQLKISEFFSHQYPLVISSDHLDSYSCDNRFIGEVIECSDKLDELLTSMHGVPIDGFTWKRLKRRQAVLRNVKMAANAINDWLSMQDNNSSYETGAALLNSVNDLHLAAEKLRLQALDSQESFWLNGIQRDLLLCRYSLEMDSLYRNHGDWKLCKSYFDELNKISLVSQDDRVLSKANEISMICKDILNQASTISQEFLELSQLYSELKLKFSKQNNLLFEDGLKENWYEDNYEALMNAVRLSNELFSLWTLKAKSWRSTVDSFHLSFAEELKQYNLFQSNEEICNDSLAVISNVTLSMRQSSEFSFHLLEDINAFQPSMDQRKISFLIGALGQMQEYGKGSLESYLLLFLSRIMADAVSWNEEAINLFPTKAPSSRLKNSGSTFSGLNLHSTNDLVLLLSKPIARSVAMPSHDRLLPLLQEAISCRKDLRMLLLLNNDRKDFQSDILKDSTNLLEIGKRLANVPLNLMESRVVEWAQNIFSWLHTYPFPASTNSKANDNAQSSLQDNSESMGGLISFEKAKSALESGKPFVDISQFYMEALIDLGLMEIDVATNTPTGLSPKSHPNLSYFFDVYENLESEVDRTVSFQKHVDDLVNQGSKYVVSQFTRLLEEYESLPVEPDPKYRKVLDKILGKSGVSIPDDVSPSNASSGSSKKASSRPQRGSMNDEDIYYRGGDLDELEIDSNMGNDDEYYRKFSHGFESTDMDGQFKKSRKRSRSKTDGSAMEVDTDNLSPVKEIKSHKASGLSSSSLSSRKHSKHSHHNIRRCAAKNCDNELDWTDGMYCSDICAGSSAEETFDGLMKYRELLGSEFLVNSLCPEKRDSLISNSQDRQLIFSSFLTQADRELYSFKLEKAMGHFSSAYSLLLSDRSGSGWVKPSEEDNEEKSDIISSKHQRISSNVAHWIASHPSSFDSLFLSAATVSDVASTNNPMLPKALSHLHHDDSVKYNCLRFLTDINSVLHHLSPNNGSSPRAAPSNVVPPVISDTSFRLHTRWNLEDVIANGLIRQNVKGAMALASIFSVELEEDLFTKYCTQGDFNRKEYRSHSLMLLRNLCYEHNDIYLVQIVNGYLTVGNLLSFSSQQFADPTLRQLREKSREDFLKDAERPIEMSLMAEIRGNSLLGRDSDIQMNKQSTFTPDDLGKEIVSISSENPKDNLGLASPSSPGNNEEAFAFPSEDDSPNIIADIQSVVQKNAIIQGDLSLHADNNSNGEVTFRQTGPLRMVSKSPSITPEEQFRREIDMEEKLLEALAEKSRNPSQAKSSTPHLSVSELINRSMSQPTSKENTRARVGASWSEDTTEEEDEMDLHSNKDHYENSHEKLENSNSASLHAKDVSSGSSVNKEVNQYVSEVPLRLLCVDGGQYFQLEKPGLAPMSCSAVVFDRYLNLLSTFTPFSNLPFFCQIQ